MKKRCLVCVVSKEAIPNFLFIKEKIINSDELLFISSSKFQPKIDFIKKALGEFACVSREIILEDSIEEKWEAMAAVIRENLYVDYFYMVNLTGGTKYMALAIYNVFFNFDSKFYYIPYPKNILLQTGTNESFILDTRVSVKDYLTMYGVNMSEKDLALDKSYTDYFFDLFVKGFIDFEVVDLLRAYRDSKQINIIDIEHSKNTNKKYPQIGNLSKMLSEAKFPMRKNGFLLKEEIRYITGGWFEEYVYYRIFERVRPQDIRLGVNIYKSELELNKDKYKNDLDVVFTLGNKLFIIECKTGINSQKMFHETVHKATSIKESLLGLPANSYIFSLAGYDERLVPITKTMGVTYYDRTYFVDEDKFSMIITDIVDFSKD